MTCCLSSDSNGYNTRPSNRVIDMFATPHVGVCSEICEKDTITHSLGRYESSPSSESVATQLTTRWSHILKRASPALLATVLIWLLISLLMRQFDNAVEAVFVLLILCVRTFFATRVKLCRETTESILNTTTGSSAFNWGETVIESEAARNPSSSSVFSSDRRTYAACVVDEENIANSRSLKLRTDADADADADRGTESLASLRYKLSHMGGILALVNGVVYLFMFLSVVDAELSTEHVNLPSHFFEIGGCLAKHTIILLTVVAVDDWRAIVKFIFVRCSRNIATYGTPVVGDMLIEKLASCDVVCCHKTGTLTTGEMCAVEVLTVHQDAGSNSCRPVSRSVNSFEGSICEPSQTHDYGSQSEAVLQDSAAVEMLVAVAQFCRIGSTTSSSPDNVLCERANRATDAALMEMVSKISSLTSSRQQGTLAQWQSGTAPHFSRRHRLMSVVCVTVAGHKTRSLFVKGAPETLVRQSSRVMLSSGRVVPLTSAIAHSLQKQIDAMSDAERGLRCIAFAFRPVLALEPTPAVEYDLTFLGVCGMLNPLRNSVRRSLAQCKTAGIRVVTMTGDSKCCAETACQQLGLLDYPVGGEASSYKSLSGDEFSKMTSAEKHRAVQSVVLFSRVDAEQKKEIITLLQSQGHVCAVAGGGEDIVGDLPALEQAGVGFVASTAVGMAKAPRCAVVTNNQTLPALVEAVFQSRAAEDRAALISGYALSSTSSISVCVLVLWLAGLPAALTSAQFLWVGVALNGLLSLTLCFTPPDTTSMERPLHSSDALAAAKLATRQVLLGVYTGLAAATGFSWAFLIRGISFTEAVGCTDVAILVNARTIAFTILAVSTMLCSLNALSCSQSLVEVRPTMNPPLLCGIAACAAAHLVVMYMPFLASGFGVTPLDASPLPFMSVKPLGSTPPATQFLEWKMVMVLSIPVVFISEGAKYVGRTHSYADVHSSSRHVWR